MKLSIDCYDAVRRLGFDDGLKMIKNAGFDCVDMSYYWDCESTLLGDDYIEVAKRTRAVLDGIGLTCNQAHAPFNVKHDTPLNTSSPAYLAVVRAMESAAIMGAKCIVVHALGIPPTVKGGSEQKLNLRYYRSLQPYAEKFGIKIAIENLFARDEKRRCFRGRLHTPELMRNMLDGLKDGPFVACIDVGHAALTGSEPEDYILGMRGEQIGCLHIQDGDYLDDRHTLPYLGKFNWDEITAALAKVGYKGELTFEIFKYLSGFPNEMLPDALKLAESVGRRLISLCEAAKEAEN